jgi:hypothetical protein
MIITKTAIFLLLVVTLLAPCCLGYRASSAVRSAHNIPHLNQQFQLIDNSQFTIDQEYIVSLFVFPAVMLGAGLISILIFTTLWLFRCICTACCRCCKCLQCLPDESRAKSMDDDQLADLRHKIVRSRRKVLGFFLGFVLLGILASQTTLLGNTYITKGVRKEVQALGDAKDFFYEIADYSGSVNSNSEEINDILKDDVCVNTYSTFVKDFYAILDNLESVSSSIEDSVDSIADGISKGQDLLVHYGIDTKNIVMYSTYAFYMFLLILFLASIYFKSPAFTRILCIFTISIVLVLTILIFVETILVMFLGDICLDPAGNVARIFPKGDARDIVVYYTTCEGTNPLNKKVFNTTVYTAQLNAEYDKLTTLVCPTDDQLKSVKPYLDDLTQDTVNLIGLTDCTTIYDVWNHGVNQGLCTYLFNGLFTLWIGQYVLSGSLFLAMCFGVVLYGYYGHLWKVTDNDENSYDPNHPEDKGCACCCSGRSARIDREEIVYAGEVQMGPPQAVATIQPVAYDLVQEPVTNKTPPPGNSRGGTAYATLNADDTNTNEKEEVVIANVIYPSNDPMNCTCLS